MNIQVYKSKSKLLPGSSYEELYKEAYSLYRFFKKRTKRKPYIRSAYFSKEKIFLEVFWIHLHQKNRKEKTKRLKYYSAAIDLLIYSRNRPTIKINPNNVNVRLYRFYGAISNTEYFYVQVKENIKTKQKFFMSVFPVQKKDLPHCGV